MSSGERSAWSVLAVGVFSLSWSSVFILLCDAPSAVIAFYRVLGAVFLLLPARLRSRSRGAPWVTLPAAISGLLLALHWLTWIQAVQTTSVASAVFLVSTQPAFTVLVGALFLGERPGRRALGGVAIAAAGMALVAAATGSGGRATLGGNLLALLSAGFGATYLLIGRGSRVRIDFIPYLFCLYLFAALALGLLVLILPVPFYPYPAATWFWIGALTLFCSVIGHGSLNWAVRHLVAWLVNLALLLEPILATLYAWWLLGQRPGGLVVPGAVLVIGGLAAAVWGERRERQPPAIASF